MSFGVADERTDLEWRGTSPNTVFAQRRNLARPAFLGMLRDIARFHRLARDVVRTVPDVSVSLEDVLSEHQWTPAFREWYLIPLGSSIWSADPTNLTKIPAVTVLQFFERHGLLDVGKHPDWHTVSGGLKKYVDAILERLRAAGNLRLSTAVTSIAHEDDFVEVPTERGTEHLDNVVVATHSDQALAILSAIPYQPNRATLHTDSSVMPRNRRAWASWNFHRLDGEHREVTLTY